MSIETAIKRLRVRPENLKTFEFRITCRFCKSWKAYILTPAIGRHVEIIIHDRGNCGFAVDGIIRWCHKNDVSSTWFRDIGCHVFANLVQEVC